MRIYLIGFMGCGKTHIGKRLAKGLKLSFIDLDDKIEQGEKSSISDIFKQEGEVYFRELEQKYLHQTPDEKNVLISCGGGTPCFFDNIDWMNQHGLTIYLKTPVDLLIERLKDQSSRRPLIAGKSEKSLTAFILMKLSERSYYYEKANVIYHQKSNNQKVVQDLIDNLNVIIGH